MRWVIYGKPAQPIPAAWAAGLDATGERYAWRNLSVFTPDQIERGFEAVAVFGSGERARWALAGYSDLPRVVLDIGHLARDRHYIKAALGSPAWLPPFPCPADRARVLGIELSDRPLVSDAVLVLGQVPDDGAHGYNARRLRQELERLVREVRSLTRRPVLYRPHPHYAGLMLDDYDTLHDPRQVTLAQSLAVSGVAVTVNSTAGLEAYAHGLPVHAAHHECPYAQWSLPLAEALTAGAPSLESRQDLVNRAAYAQWTGEEMAAGKAWQFIKGVLAGKRLEVKPQPVAPPTPPPKRSKATPPAPKPAPAPKPKATPLDSLAPRARKALKAAGMATMEDAAALTDEALLELPGVGPAAVRRIREVC